MMNDVAVLVSELNSYEGEPEQERWMNEFCVDVALKVVNLAGQLQYVNEYAVKAYPAALADALSMLPRHAKFEVLTDTLEVLRKVADGNDHLRSLIDLHLVDSFEWPVFAGIGRSSNLCGESAVRR